MDNIRISGLVVEYIVAIGVHVLRAAQRASIANRARARARASPMPVVRQLLGNCHWPVPQYASPRARDKQPRPNAAARLSYIRHGQRASLQHRLAERGFDPRTFGR